VLSVLSLVTDDHDSKILGCNSGFDQRQIFGNGIVFSITFPGCKGLKRRTPDIRLAVLSEVGSPDDGEINGAIDLAQARATGRLPS
jgi:hypothetical protein